MSEHYVTKHGLGQSPSLRQQFRLCYGEGTGAKAEAAFRLFELGYKAGQRLAWKEVADLWECGDFHTDILVAKLRSLE